MFQKAKSETLVPGTDVSKSKYNDKEKNKNMKKNKESNKKRIGSFKRINRITAYFLTVFLVMSILGESQLSNVLINTSVPIADAATRLDSRTYAKASDISYEETTDEVLNPYIGFYRPCYMTLKRAGNSASTTCYNLTHIRCDLSDFSASFNGSADAEISRDALDAFEGTLKNLRKKHCTAIVRFAYHPNFDGSVTYEPSMKMILKHQAQLGSVISNYSDVVVVVECGLFGLWGEMHGSSMCNAANFNKAIDKWLEVLPKSITVNVRTPGYYCDWCGADRNKLSSNAPTRLEKAYRVGIYNDGYLGSDTDLGTFANRSEEIAWLKNQANHTLYGGEIVANDGSGNVKNTAAFMETEAFKTHTSYLNIEWNNNVIDEMKNEKYSGPDSVYNGKTGFEFIRNRLGYRYVVRDVRLSVETSVYDNFQLEAEIENVGFANLIRSKKMILIFSGVNGIYKFPVSGWKAQKKFTINMEIDIPDNMPKGKYQIYLRLADDETSEGADGYPIKFANKEKSDGNSSQVTKVWNENLGANLLGSFSVVEPKTRVNDSTETEQEKKQDGRQSKSTEAEQASTSEDGQNKTSKKVKNSKTTFNIKNKSRIKKTAKIIIRDKDKIKKVTLNGKKIKIKKNKTKVTIKLKSYKKILKKKGKWNKLVVLDKKGKKRVLKFKIKK